MKTAILIFVTVLLFASCKNESETNSTAETASQNIDTIPVQQDGNIVSGSAFNPETIPESTADIGQFPYYTVPDWLKTGDYSNEREQDFNLFEFYTGNGFYPVEGRLSVKYFNAKGDSEYNTGTWNEYKFVQSFRKHLESLGAKKIWEGTIPWEAFEQLEKEKNKKDYSFDHSHKGSQENQIVYALRQGGKIVFFLIASNSAYGSVIVAENGELQ